MPSPLPLPSSCLCDATFSTLRLLAVSLGLGVLAMSGLRADSTTVINEIFYHPAEETQTEWIELANTMSFDMDLAGWRLTGGIEFLFPEDTIIRAGGYLVVAADPAKVRLASLFESPLGPFTGRLSNEGERLELRNQSGRLMSWVTYDYREPWPAAADGSGASLAKKRPEVNSAECESWRASLKYGGTPGGTNFPEDPDTLTSLVIEETAPAGDPETFWLEIGNRGATPLTLTEHLIGVAGDPSRQTSLPAQEVPAHGRIVIPGTTLGFSLEAGDLLALYSPDRSQVFDVVEIDEIVRGRSKLHPRRWLFPTEASPGQENPFSFQDKVVINEIMYRSYPLPPSPAAPPVFAERELSARPWRFWQGVPQSDASWTTAAFDDTSWETGQAPFAGGTSELPADAGTPTTLAIGKSVSYFRLRFDIDALSEGETLQLRYLVDDGAVLYLNGEELSRINLPEGEVIASTRALEPIDFPQWSDPVSVGADRLRSGENILAAELHPSSAFDRAVAFSVRLSLGEQVTPAQPAQPFRDRPEEWIELHNHGETDADLSGWRIEEGITYTFAEQTILPAGGFVVIANDAEHLRALYPDIPMLLGDFRGSLSNSGENILLRDAEGNPADEVRYYEGGRWPAYADGGGSSLELRDPRADNAHAEAWTASDESSKASWHAFQYRMISGQNYGLNTWKELNLGMLSDGEILIDDLQVIHDPEGDAKPIIRNGSFAGTLFNADPGQHWRAVGNHRHTATILDPEDPGNHVLHIRASGATDTKHNHIETTFIGNAPLVDGDLYEVRLRARWVAGSNQLNARGYFARLARTLEVPVPQQLGTPGQHNSRKEPQLGPTYQGFTHRPLIPAPTEAVTVSVTAGDPDGIEEVILCYRPDGESTFTKVLMESIDGLYQGSIPPQPAGTVVQFFVEGRDTAGAVSTFPASGQASRALYVVDDGRGSQLPIHQLRLIMTKADFDFLLEPLNLISNERLGATILVDQREAVYDTGVRLKGSPAGRARDGALYQGFNLGFPPHQLYRGLHDSVSVDRSGRSPRAGDQDEVYIKHLFNRAGVPAMMDDLGYFISPTSTHTGTALFSMARYGRLFTSTQFENGDQGSVFNLEITYDPTSTVAGPDSVKKPIPFSHGGRTDFQDLGDDKEQYRWALEMRTGRRADDYEGLIRFCQTMDLPKDQLARKIDEVMDVDTWMRTAALHNLCGIGDTWWNAGLEHNMRIYVPPGGRGVVGLPWDLDFVFSASATAPVKSAGGNLRRVMDLPVPTRLYYGHLLDLVDTIFNEDYMARWLSHYGSRVNQNFNSQLGYIRSRSAFVRDRLLREVPPVPFAVTFPASDGQETSEHAFSARGQAWIDVRTVRLAGTDHQAQWISGSEWELTLPLVTGANTFLLQAFDFQDRLLHEVSLSVNRTSAGATPYEHLRLTELHFHPAEPEGDERRVSTDAGDYEFLELHNLSAQPLDLSTVTMVDGVSWSLPPGTVLPGLAYGVVVKNRAAFLARYGEDPLILGEFAAGNLNNGGEGLRLLDGSHAILTFAYEEDWVPEADGGGPSLVVRRPGDPREAWQTPDQWQASREIHGSPGREDPAPPDGGLTYASWSDAVFSQSPAEAALPRADPDGDRISNLVEFVFALNPLQSDGPATLQWSRGPGGENILHYQRRRHLSDVTVTLQASSDLQAWTTLDQAAVQVTPVDEDRERVTLELSSDAPYRYVRLFLQL